MITVFVYQNGETKKTDRVEPQWLDPAPASRCGWISCSPPLKKGSTARRRRSTSTRSRSRTRSARSTIPRSSRIDRYLYVILHGIDFQGERARVRHARRRLLPRRELPGHRARRRARAASRSSRDSAQQHAHILAEGPVALMHRIVDSMVDNYAPGDGRSSKSRWTSSRKRPSSGRRAIWCGRFSRSSATSPRMRRVAHPAAGRRRPARAARVPADLRRDGLPLSRRLRPPRPATPTKRRMFQDRVTGILEGYLSAISNRLNQVMKVLTVMSTIFLPLTVLTGMWGMNVPLPHVPGRRARAVLVDCRHHGRDQRGDAGAVPPQALDLTPHGQDSSAAARSRQPDCRRRSRRAAGLGHQGAGRERDRRRRAPHRDRRRARRQEADSCRRRWRGDGRRRTRGWRSSGTRRARSADADDLGADRHARLPRRSAAEHRVGLAFHAADARARRRVRHRDPRQRRRRRVGDGSRDAGRHVDRGRRCVLQPAGAPQVPEVRRAPSPRRSRASSRSWRSAIRRSASR